MMIATTYKLWRLGGITPTLNYHAYKNPLIGRFQRNVDAQIGSARNQNNWQSRTTGYTVPGVRNIKLLGPYS